MNRQIRIFTLLLLLSIPLGVRAQKDPLTDAGESTPMSCHIEGKVVKVLNARDNDKKSACAKHPCRALVKVIGVTGCGSSVSMLPAEGEIYEMRFVYTLHNTRRIFPGMKVIYPGLKKGQYFTARIEQRLRPGTEGEFVVYGYRRK